MAKISLFPLLLLNSSICLLLLLQFCTLFPLARSEQRIVEEPEDTVARTGQNVVLKCRVQHQRGQVIWMKGDIGLGYKRDLPFWERMSMVGSLGEGEFHLEIRNVTLADEDTYQCQLSSTDDEPQAKLSRRARLTVIVEPQGPVLLGESIAPIQRNQPIATTEGQPIRLSCQSEAGKPPAKISWAIAEDWQAQRLVGRIGNGTAAGEAAGTQMAVHPMRAREHHSANRRNLQQQLAGNITEIVELNEDSQLFTVTSHLTFAPGKEENGRWLVCLAAHQAYGLESRTTSIEMDVFYAPKVRVEVDSANSQLHEGGHVQFRCLSDARPSEDLKFSWRWDGEPKRLEVLDSQRAMIAGLRFNDNGKRVSCAVENSIGAGNAIFEMDVPYGPRFMSNNQTKTVDRGSEVTFQCEALGNPAPIVRWYHGRDWETPVFEGKNFTIRNAQDWEEGEYRCTAEVDGFAPDTLYHMLYLKGPPKVHLSEFVVTDGGDTVTLICEIQSRAFPLRVHWFHNGQRVDIEHPAKADAQQQGRPRRYQVHDEKLGRHELVSRLTIHGFGPEDSGMWNCSAKNDYGLVWAEQNVEVLGLVQKMVKYAQTMPTEWKACVLAAILFLALLLALLLCCICHRQKCCCCPRNGHSKLSSHSSDPRGEFSVKCEELDGLTNNSSTPPFAQQHFYNGTAVLGQQQQQHGMCGGTEDNNYMCGAAQYNPDMDQSVLYGLQQQQAFGLVPNAVQQQQQQFNDYFAPGGSSPNQLGHQMLLGNGANGGMLLNGAGSTFGPAGAASSTFVGTGSNHQIYGGNPPAPGPSPMSPYDSFNIARVQFPSSQAQQFYGYTAGGQSPLETVTEVCTPESQEQQLAGDERTLSRISTHV